MRLIIMFIAIALAAGAFFITMHFTSEPQESKLPVVTPEVQVKEAPSVDIYTAKQDISIGTIIKPEMLDIQPWPKHLVLEDMVVNNPGQPTDVVKMVVRTPFSKGEPIIRNKLANASDPSFLAASLPKGMRVVTIAVDAVSGIGGFVFPGDRVDVLVTHDIVLGKNATSVAATTPAPGSTTSAATVKKDPVTEVLLSNVRVMAVNQKSTAHGGEPPILPNNISLEVSASDAQKLRLTENGNGRLSLALRSLKDKEEMQLARPTGIGDLSRLTPPSYFPVLYDNNGQTPAPADAKVDDDDSKSSITVVRGVKAEAVEVSRP